MATIPDHYKALNVSPRSSQREIKNAYRRLAKKFHPDTCGENVDRQRIIAINQAYEILGDRSQRQAYDALRNTSNFRGVRYGDNRTPPPRQETDLNLWLHRIYRPIAQVIHNLIDALEEQLEELSADPFDDDLMAAFQEYIEDGQSNLSYAQNLFQSLPNPSPVAKASQDLYYCLNHLGDGLEQLHWFTLNYNDDYLYTGKEMFRRADHFSWQAQQAIAQL